MKTKSDTTRRHALLGLLILLLGFLPALAPAQTSLEQEPEEEGIVMYSDTSGTASADFTPQSTSSYDPSPATNGSTVAHTGRLFHPVDLMTHLFDNLLSIGLILGALLIVLAIGIPLLLIIGLVYLILKLTRTDNRTPRPGEPPLTPEEIREQQRQQVIRLASTGTALLLVEWFFGLAHIAGIVGVILLCIAAGQWLSRRK